LKRWNLATGKEDHSWTTTAGEGRALGFSPDGRMLALGVEYTGVVLRDAADGKHLHTLSGPEKDVWVIAFSADGKLLAAGGADRTLWVWRTSDGKIERILNQQAKTDALTFHPNGRFVIVVTGEHDYTLRIWDLATGDDRLDPQRVSESAYAIAFRPDGRTLGGVEFDGRVWLRDGESGELKQNFPAPDPDKEEKSWPMPVALGPAGWLAAKEDKAGRLVVWQTGTNPLRRRILSLGAAADRGVSAVAFSPDGRYVAVGNPDGTIGLLRLAEPGRLPELSTP
jgi:WD40 repeat protein